MRKSFDREEKRLRRQKDGFLEYGITIENFFNLEWWLVKIFFWLTVLSIPQMIIYGLNWSPSTLGAGSVLNSLSFGGLGQAVNICAQGHI